MRTISDASVEEINVVMARAWEAFQTFRNEPLKRRADLMRAIALKLEKMGDDLLSVSMRETNLPEARLRNERARTIFQLTSYADACEKGDWLELRIDTANQNRNPPRPDIRKTKMGLGPVVVLGASNFPFAYSTAGGDTACALAAGCPVIVKAHPAHAETSAMVANAIHEAVSESGLPAGVFSHVHGASYEVGKTLIMHEHTKAVGFTGSYTGGKQLFDWANQRKEPIPVFAEMGSINPVFLLPGKLSFSAKEIATQYAGSITLGVGQFCTNPGLIVGIDSEPLHEFIWELGTAIKAIPPGLMLHAGIARAFYNKRALALAQDGVEEAAVSDMPASELMGLPTIAVASGSAFLHNPQLHQEVFGPYSLVIRCRDANEMMEVARHLEGQLTTTVMATEKDVEDHSNLVELIGLKCGRFIWNGVPTGVEVCLSMQHGGPFPATSDSRFTAVGADGIKRFVRPIAYQGWPDQLLPVELQNANPLGIWRTVNNQLSKDPIT